MSNNEKIMDRVAALLRIAEHPNTPAPEAEVALRQANSLMTKHAIDEAILRQAQSINERRAIAKATIVLGGGEFSPYLRTIFEVAADTFRVSTASQGRRGEDGYYTEWSMYGAQEDVSWLDMFFNMVKIQFLSKLDPKWDESKSYDENIYNFKVAGYKWAEIDQQAMAHGHERSESSKLVVEIDATLPDDHFGSLERWSDRVELQEGRFIDRDRNGVWQVREYNGFFHKLKAAYVRHAKAIGDDTRVKTQSHQTYRLSFAESFRRTLTQRLWQMQRDAEAEMDTIPGAALAIRDMKAEADEALWADFPNLHPDEVAKRLAATRAQREAEEKAREEMLAAMTSAERQKFLEQEEAEARKQARRNRAWERKNSFYMDSSAEQRGSQAAMSVDLSRKAGSAGQGATRGELG